MQVLFQTWNTGPALFPLYRVIEEVCKCAKPVDMCSVDLEKAFDGVTWGKMWRVLMCQGSIAMGHSVYMDTKQESGSCGSKLDLFRVEVRLHQGYLLSQNMFITFIDNIFWCRQGVEGVQLSGIRIWFLLFDVVLSVSLYHELQLSLKRFTVKRKAAGRRLNTSKSEAMLLGKGLSGLFGF